MNELTDEMIPVIDYNHIFLYSKFWYKHTDLIDDLQTLFHKKCGVDRKHFTPDYMVELLLDFVLPHMNNNQTIEVVKISMGSSFRCTGTIENKDPRCINIYTEDVLAFLIGQLSIVSVKDDKGFLKYNLGEPDPEVLILGKGVPFENKDN